MNQDSSHDECPASSSGHPSSLSNQVQSYNEKFDALRDANVGDLGAAIPQIPYQFFADSILPRFPHDGDVLSIIQALKTAGDIDAAGRWRAFPVDPCHDARTEQEVFDYLYLVTSAIASHIVPTAPGLAVTYESQPDHVLIPEFSKLESNPDGCFLLKKRFRQFKQEDRTNSVVPDDSKSAPAAKDGSEKSAIEGADLDSATFCEGQNGNNPADQDDAKKKVERRYWRDICTPAEFKKENIPNELKDNVLKICWDIHQVLHEDPRRRFTFAFTIDNRDMRVWFASRSDMLVSDPFDFMTDHEKVVHFFLSQFSSDDVSLGLDPTMQLVGAEPEKIPVYDISVHVSDSETVRYRTMGLINQEGAAGIRGRATRIWDVAAIINNRVSEKQTGVLKDYWVDSDRKREGTILHNIQSAQENRTKYEKLFLTVLAHGDVLLDNSCRGGARHISVYSSKQVDDTRLLMTSGVTPPSSSWFDMRVPESQPSRSEEVEDPTVCSLQAGRPNFGNVVVSYCSKAHYRIVFQQKCTPLFEITSLSKACMHLANAVRALHLIHNTGCGWVHRDVSTGNILIDSEGNARLADLEYAKRLDDDKSHDVRIGTAAYMAVEVEQGSYAFPPVVAPATDRPKTGRTLDDLFAPGATRIPSKRESIKLLGKFSYNALHDLESVWWIFLEFLFEMERSLPDEANTRTSEPVQRGPELREYSTDLFHDLAKRSGALCSTNPFLELAISALPARLSAAGNAALYLKCILARSYRAYESKPTLVPREACPESVYIAFAHELLALSHKFKGDDVVLMALGAAPPTGLTGAACKVRETEKATKTAKQSTQLFGPAVSSGTGKRKLRSQGGSTAGKKRKGKY